MNARLFSFSTSSRKAAIAAFLSRPPSGVAAASSARTPGRAAGSRSTTRALSRLPGRGPTPGLNSRLAEWSSVPAPALRLNDGCRAAAFASSDVLSAPTRNGETADSDLLVFVPAATEWVIWISMRDAFVSKVPKRISNVRPQPQECSERRRSPLSILTCRSWRCRP